MNDIQDALNQLYQIVKCENFAGGKGRGVEEPYFVFDYEPSLELDVRAYITDTLLPKLINRTGSESVIPQTLNLFEIVINELRQEGFYEGALELQQSEGNDALAEALEGIVKAEYLAERIAEQLSESSCNLLLINGVGSAWPMVCIHSLLSSLQSNLSGITVILFYPGECDDDGFKLFYKIKEDHHYPAHSLLV